MRAAPGAGRDFWVGHAIACTRGQKHLERAAPRPSLTTRGVLLQTEPTVAPELSARLFTLLSCVDAAIWLRYDAVFVRSLTVAGRLAFALSAADLATAGVFRRADVVDRPSRKRMRPW